MNKQIIIINGTGGTGKDTFVDFCRNITPVYNVSSVDRVKEAAKILGWTGGKTEADRLFLSNIKDASTVYNDDPYELIKSHIVWFRSEAIQNCNLMFIHIREPKEIERVKKEFNCTTLFIRNKNVADITSNHADGNVANYMYDIVINNNGTLEDLEHKAKVFICELS